MAHSDSATGLETSRLVTPTLPLGRTIEKEIFIKASPERVFDAFTSSDALAHWWAMAEAELDLRPGGRWRFKWTSGQSVHGIIVEVERPRRLVMDWDEGEHLHDTRLTVEFHAENGGTRIHLVDTGYGSGGDWDALYEGVTTGWGWALEGLRAWLEEGIDFAFPQQPA
ncbi:MAG: SRPBCC domain-containing protein [Chloroflexi bacterium]|nr:MAG: SRPBCC domain-containing protein [Chloroflexota bacterium]